MKISPPTTPRRFLPAALCLLFASPAPASRAALIAHDNFNSYSTTPTNALNGRAGGSLWGSSESTQNEWSAITGVTVSSASSDEIIYMLDGQRIGGGHSLKIAADSPAALSRAIVPDSSGTPYFVSFIFKIRNETSSGPVSGNVFAGWQALDAWPDYNNDSIGFIGSAGKAGARVKTSGNSFGTALNYNQTYLFVIKYDGWNGSTYTRVQVWLNPSRNDEGTTNSAITVSYTNLSPGAGSTGFNGLRVRTSGLTSTVYHLVDDIRIGTAWDDVVSPGVGAPVVFSHPGIESDTGDLGLVRARVKANGPVDPQATAWTGITAGGRLANLLSHTSNAASTIECSDTAAGTPLLDQALHKDAQALHDLALAWQIEGNTAYADKAIALMNSWASTLVEIKTKTGSVWGTHNLHVAWTAHRFAEVAEIIRHTYKDGSGNPIWPAAEITAHEAMLTTKFYPHLPSGGSQYGNWEASYIHSILSIAVFTDNHGMFDRGTRMLRGGGNGAISVYLNVPPGPGYTYIPGHCRETTRDRLHSQMGLGDIARSCEIAWQQGVDLYSAYPETSTTTPEYVGLPRLAAALDYMGALLDGQERPAYLQDGTYKSDFGYSNPKNFDVNELMEVGYNHYRHRIGYALPNLHNAIKEGRIGGYDTQEQKFKSTHVGLYRTTLLFGDRSVARGNWPFVTGARQSLSFFGWEGWGALGAGNAVAYTPAVLPSASTDARLGVHNVAGAGGVSGVLFAHSGTTGARNDRFVVTTTFDEPSSGPSVGTLSWMQAFSNVGTTSTRVLVQVNGQWYASSGTFSCATSSSAGSMTNAETKTLDLAGAAGLGTTEWSPISFGDNASINLGAKVVTPIGTSLTGVGLLLVTDNASGRALFIDNIELTGPAGP